jgi:phosphoserine phosphatase RsbU/P
MSGVVLDGLTGRFVMHSAGGHPPILISSTGNTTVLPCRGTPLGSRGFSSGAKGHQLSAGDRLVLYTDGILELPLERGRMLGIRSFAAMCKDTINLELSDAIRTVVDKADDLRRDMAQSDDWTIVMMEWLG